MTAGRTFTVYAEQDPEVKPLLEALLLPDQDVDGYRESMRQLGTRLARSILPVLCAESAKEVCVICTVEDADFLARGLIEELESHHSKTRMICMWNDRIRSKGLSISPVRRTYQENYDKNDAIFIIVKSIISGACVVKTNLTKALSAVEPKRVFVAAPVILQGAEERLSKEFPSEISKKFQYVYFASDSRKSEDGEEVIPGIGGSVYELLGLGDSNTKNSYVPNLVQQRRRIEYPLLQSESKPRA